MVKSRLVKIVVFVPASYANLVRQAMGQAGAGKLGHYEFCSFSTRGAGRFKPMQGAHPTIGRRGQITQVKEERIETICPRVIAKKVVVAIKSAHPYEEVALDVYPLEEI